MSACKACPPDGYRIQPSRLPLVGDVLRPHQFATRGHVGDHVVVAVDPPLHVEGRVVYSATLLPKGKR